MVAEVWEILRRSMVLFRGQPVGTIAAKDQVFVRDFVPSALAFLINGEPDIVKNFLFTTLHIQGWENRLIISSLGRVQCQLASNCFMILFVKQIQLLQILVRVQ